MNIVVFIVIGAVLFIAGVYIGHRSRQAGLAFWLEVMKDQEKGKSDGSK